MSLLESSRSPRATCVSANLRGGALPIAIVVVLGVLLWPAVAVGQDQPDPADAARKRLGPVAFTPTLTTSLGVDTNVFNVAGGGEDDVVGGVRPHVDAWLRLGRARLVASSTVDFVYFKQYEGERSINTQNTARLELASSRIRPYTSVSFDNSRQRLNFEIDTRARYVQRAFTAGVDVRVAGRTSLEVAAGRADFAFSEEARQLPTDLGLLLNRDTGTVTFSIRQRLTPLTTLVASAQRAKERFESSPLRDSTSFSFTPGVEFSPFALLSGTAFVGYRRFAPQATVVPEYTGVVASVDLGYTLLGSTRFGVRATRDVAYSAEELEPYYVLTGIGGAVATRLTSAWELVGNVGRQRLAYRRVQASVGVPGGVTTAVGNASVQPVDGRVDTVLTFLAGVGYRLGADSRVGLNVNYHRRQSPLDDRRFRGVRVNSEIVYGF